MAYSGRGVARLNGKTYFVDDTFPGEVALCRIVEDKKTFANAIPIEFKTRSPERVQSSCPVSESCGGCQWLEAPYHRQLEWKKQFILDALQRIAKIQWTGTMDVAASNHQYHYRNRVTLRGTIAKDGSIGVGYFMKESRVQVHTEHCSIASESINKIIYALSKARTKATAQKFRLELQELPAKDTTQEPCILATVYAAEKNYHDLRLLVDELQRLPEVLWAGMTFDLKEAPATIFDIDEKNFFSKPGLFQQVNSDLNRQLRRYIRNLVDTLDSRFIGDLFCGSGNLSLQLANPSRRIIGVEFDRQAIEMAKFNVQQNKAANVRYDSGDAALWLAKLLRSGQHPDLIIADPPRKGMKDLLPSLLALRPLNIIYVSCDPATLARDISELLPAYQIKSVQGFDFFPNTFHVETVVHLSRSELQVNRATSDDL